VGEAIASSQVRYKILILNGSLDRETKPEGMEYGARDFIAAIADACASSRSKGPPLSSPEEEGAARAPKEDYKHYVTHVIHLAGEGTPTVGKSDLSDLGIECVRIYGRKGKEGDGMIYDGTALGQALEAIIGKPKQKGDGRGGSERRNTLGVGNIVM